jgi:hypothetical protein
MPRADYRLPGIYNATPITLPDGAGAAPALDINGKLILSPTSGSGGIYNATPPILIDGQTSQLQVDVNSNLKTTLATSIAGEDIPNDVLKVEERFNYNNITSTATTLVKTGVGFLHAITVNTPVASSVITLYDNTSAAGTKMGTITLPATLLQEGPYTALYDVTFSVGLTVVTATAASDLTVSYR